jgi:hypothetical protein
MTNSIVTFVIPSLYMSAFFSIQNTSYERILKVSSQSFSASVGAAAGTTAVVAVGVALFALEALACCGAGTNDIH